MRISLWFTLSVAFVLTVVVPAYGLAQYAVSRGWSHSTATIVRAYGAPNFDVGTSRNPTNCALDYRYEVAGATYRGTKIGFNSRSMSGGAAPAYCRIFYTQAYPAPGDTVPIAYNPGRPEEAVAYPMFPRESFLGLVAGLFAWGAVALVVRRMSGNTQHARSRHKVDS